MIIVKLYLTNFGKFKNRVLDLTPGLNIIYGANEAGKSTVRSFIEGMLYGFKKPNAAKRIFTEEKQRYKPWLNTTYAGAMEYSTDNKIYRIERDFLNDKISIYDAESGNALEYAVLPGTREPDIITRHWQLNAISFANTISIDQRNTFSSKAMAKEVADTWLNVAQAGIQDVSINHAIKYLSDIIDTIGSDSAPTRPWAKAHQKLEQLESEHAMAEKRISEMQENIARAHVLRIEINDIRTGKVIDESQTALLKNRKQLLETKLKSFDNIEQHIEQLMSIERQLQETKSELEKLRPIEANENMENEITAIQRRRWLYSISGCIVLIATIKFPPSAMALIPIIGLTVYDRHNEKKLRKQIQHSSYQLKNQREALDKKYAELENTKHQICDIIGVQDITQAIELIKQKDILTLEIEQVNNECKQVKQKSIHDKEVELAALEARTEAMLSDIRPLAAIEEEMEYIKQQIKDMDIQKQAAYKAISVIKKLSDQIQSDFSIYINDASTPLIKHMTDGRYNSINISNDLQIKVIDPGNNVLVPLEQLSTGTIDQLYMAVRLTIADMLSEHKKLPLIIDDAFSEYDDKRLKNAIEYIAELAQKRQVIFMTCHKRDVQALQNLNARYNSIEL